MELLLKYWPVIAAVAAWICSIVGILMFLSRWFGRFEERMDKLVETSVESKGEIKELRTDMHTLGEKVSNIDGRVTALERK